MGYFILKIGWNKIAIDRENDMEPEKKKSDIVRPSTSVETIRKPDSKLDVLLNPQPEPPCKPSKREQKLNKQ